MLKNSCTYEWKNRISSPEDAFADYQQLVDQIEEELLKVISAAGKRKQQQKKILSKLQQLDQKYLETKFLENVTDHINFHIHC